MKNEGVQKSIVDLLLFFFKFIIMSLVDSLLSVLGGVSVSQDMVEVFILSNIGKKDGVVFWKIFVYAHLYKIFK